MKALLQQALEALESVLPPLVTPEIAKAIPAVRTAIKQAEQAQPVGVLQEGGRMHGITYTCLWSDLPAGTPLYTHPQPAKPLSEEQVFAAMKRIVPNWNGCGNSRESAVRLALRVIKEQS